MDEAQRLKAENQELKAKVQGLEYENKMFRQLLDNLFLGSGDVSSSHTKWTMQQPKNIFQVQPETVAAETENCTSITQPGTEIFNIGQADEEEDPYWSEEEKYSRKKYEEEEELEPQVQDTELIKSEMAKIFGEQGAKDVLALETQMQLKFERMTDKYSSQLWPCLPLNMKFE